MFVIARGIRIFSNRLTLIETSRSSFSKASNFSSPILILARAVIIFCTFFTAASVHGGVSNKEYSDNFQIRFKHYGFIETLHQDLKNNNNDLINTINNADIILFSTRWRLDNAFINLEKSISYIKAINPKAIIVIQSEAPNFFNEKKRFKLKYMYFSKLDEFLIQNNRKPNKYEIKELRKSYYDDYINDNRIIKINEKLKLIAKKNNLIFINSIEYFCDHQNYECDILTRNNKKIYYDGVHLTEEGNLHFSDIFYKKGYLDFVE